MTVVNATEQVILRNVVFRLEGVEQAFLAIGLKPHHIKALRSIDKRRFIILLIKI
jgi:hypothetical protein